MSGYPMCIFGKSQKAQVQTAAPPPSIIDTSDASNAEAATRRKRSGIASLYKTGSRLGDMSTPSLSVKSLLGQ